MIKNEAVIKKRVEGVLIMTTVVAITIGLIAVVICFIVDARYNHAMTKQIKYNEMQAKANFELFERCKQDAEFVKDIMTFDLNIEDLESFELFRADDIFTVMRCGDIFIQVSEGTLQPGWQIWRDGSVK